jgi:hypothetical protein
VDNNSQRYQLLGGLNVDDAICRAQTVAKAWPQLGAFIDGAGVTAQHLPAMAGKRRLANRLKTSVII